MIASSSSSRPAGTQSRSVADTRLARADIAVIGGGVVGCAIARQLTLDGAQVVLLEKAPDILDGASKANSAILHTGFDAPVASLEHACVREGYDEYRRIHADFNLPVRDTGALVAAWTECEEEQLDQILAQARENGVSEARILNRREVMAHEPQLAASIRAAIEVPSEAIIDPWSAPLAYLHQAVANDARAFFNAEVTDGRFDGALWHLDTAKGRVEVAQVVNCAGLHGDRLEHALLGESDFEILPRKGQFVVFDEAAFSLLNRIVLPVPTPRTKGVVLFPTIFGNLAVGPTAEEQDSRDDSSTDAEVLRGLVRFAVTHLPALKDMPVTATYAGLRPATERPEYRIRHRAGQHWVSVGGIRSTGLSAALGIARHVSRLMDLAQAGFAPVADPVIPTVPNLAEHRPRDWQVPGYGEIVCHCEMVTDREIRAALSGEVPAKSLDGLKRRTRATMGRCQGFNCTARLSELADSVFSAPISVGAAHE